jgi:hypothetical protein
MARLRAIRGKAKRFLPFSRRPDSPKMRMPTKSEADFAHLWRIGLTSRFPSKKRSRHFRRGVLGFAHALFEIAEDTLKRAKSVDNTAIRDALAATNLNTIVGPVKWGGQGPFKNVAKTPLVGGQWKKGTKHKFELAVVSNTLASNIPVQGKLELL